VAQQAWTAAAREVDGVERLVDRERTRRFAEMLKAEQDATDEAAIARRGRS
jgi:flagellar export protein FliJ